MQVSPTIPPAKRTRAKVKGAIGAPQKLRSHKKPLGSAAAKSGAELAAIHTDSDALAGLIATTAYFIAAQRNFAPGQELDDWLEAKRRIRSDHAG